MSGRRIIKTPTRYLQSFIVTPKKRRPITGPFGAYLSELITQGERYETLRETPPPISVFGVDIYKLQARQVYLNNNALAFLDIGARLEHLTTVVATFTAELSDWRTIHEG